MICSLSNYLSFVKALTAKRLLAVRSLLPPANSTKTRRTKTKTRRTKTMTTVGSTYQVSPLSLGLFGCPQWDLGHLSHQLLPHKYLPFPMVRRLVQLSRLAPRRKRLLFLALFPRRSLVQLFLRKEKIFLTTLLCKSVRLVLRQWRVIFPRAFPLRIPTRLLCRKEMVYPRLALPRSIQQIPRNERLYHRPTHVLQPRRSLKMRLCPRMVKPLGMDFRIINGLLSCDHC